MSGLCKTPTVTVDKECIGMGFNKNNDAVMAAEMLNKQKNTRWPGIFTVPLVEVSSVYGWLLSTTTGCDDSRPLWESVATSSNSVTHNSSSISATCVPTNTFRYEHKFQRRNYTILVRKTCSELVKRLAFTCGKAVPMPDSTADNTSLPLSPERRDTDSFNRSTSTRVSSGTSRLVNSSRYCGSRPTALLWLSESCSINQTGPL